VGSQITIRPLRGAVFRGRKNPGTTRRADRRAPTEHAIAARMRWLERRQRRQRRQVFRVEDEILDKPDHLIDQLEHRLAQNQELERLPAPRWCAL